MISFLIKKLLLIDYIKNAYLSLLANVRSYYLSPDILARLEKPDLSKMASDLAAKAGFSEPIKVLVTEPNDANFLVAKGAVSFWLIDQGLILIDFDFFRDQSKDVINSLVAHEANHIINQDGFVRWIFLWLTNIVKFFFVGVFVVYGYIYQSSFSSLFAIQIFNTWFSEMVAALFFRYQELKADRLSLAETGSASVNEMFVALDKEAIKAGDPANFSLFLKLRYFFFFPHLIKEERSDLLYGNKSFLLHFLERIVWLIMFVLVIKMSVFYVIKAFQLCLKFRV